jgi:putative polysaccharide biosynthesis protein
MTQAALRRPVETDAPVEAKTPDRAAPPVLDTKVAEASLDLVSSLRQIAERHGKSYQQVMFDIAKTGFGPGKLTYEEYLTLRLFDDAALAGADKSAFVGIDVSRRLWLAANYNIEWWGVMRNKLAVTSLLGAYGFPVIPTLAFYSSRISIHNATMLRKPDELAAFLRTSQAYPLFGKPMDALRSLGSVRLESYNAAADSVITSDGRTLAVERFATEVNEHFGSGYIFQRCVAPHAGVRAIAGERLATVRVMTLGGELWRAAWKIPAGANVADNFWRTGNLLATIDPGTGRITRVVRGTGLAQEEVTQHPDTGAELIGIEVPCWHEIVGMARSAAATLEEVPLIGWDMAATEAGIAIVEPNFTPDFGLPQIADRRGVLDQQFNAFLTRCRVASRDAKKRIKQLDRLETRERISRLGHSIFGA